MTDPTGTALAANERVVEAVARAICRARPSAGDPSCVMDDHPERGSCTDENCYRFAAARAAIQAYEKAMREWE